MFVEHHVDGLVFFSSTLLDNHIQHAFSTRIGGVSEAPFDSLNLGYDVGDADDNVLENRRQFLRVIGANVEQLACGFQVHGNSVKIVETPGLYQATDALMTCQSGIVLGIKTADCVPVLIYDPEHRAFACIHAGWRSVKSEILSVTINKMISQYHSNPEHLLCAIGPSIRSCCYEVQHDVADQFPDGAIIRKYGKMFLDLVHVIKNQLSEQNISADKIDDSEHCSCCRKDLYYSYRRDGAESGRMMMAAVLHE